MDEWVVSIRPQPENGSVSTQTLDHGSPVSSRLSLYPQMAADPIHGHPPWALLLVAVSVGKSSGKAGPFWGRGQTSRSHSRSPSLFHFLME